MGQTATLVTNLPWATGKKRDLKAESENLLSVLNQKASEHLKSAVLDLGDAVVEVAPHSVLPFFTLLRDDAGLRFDLLADITAVDWMDKHIDRFEVVYHLMSSQFGYRLRVKVPVSEDKPEVSTVTGLWNSANFMEREVWDMYGIRFAGHPNLKRILMYEEFKGYPLRKDYPVQQKQPRVPLRYPEVSNSARNMIRPELVSINPRHTAQDKE